MSWVETAVSSVTNASPGTLLAGANLLSGFLGSNAAGHAADVQAGAQNAATALQRDMFNTQNQQQTGYRAAGQNALANIGALGSGTYQVYDQAGNPVGTPQTGSGYLTHQFNAEDFAKGIDPGYAFRLQQGQAQAARQANLGGGAISGNALAGLQDYTQGQASQEYNNAFNRYQTQRSNIYNTLASIAGLGQTSLGQTTNAGTQAGANIGQSIANAGAAQAGGIVGSTNALAGGLTGAANGLMLSQLLKPQTQTPMTYSTTSSGPTDYSLTTGQNTGGLGLRT